MMFVESAGSTMEQMLLKIVYCRQYVVTASTASTMLIVIIVRIMTVI